MPCARCGDSVCVMRAQQMTWLSPYHALKQLRSGDAMLTGFGLVVQRSWECNDAVAEDIVVAAANSPTNRTLRILKLTQQHLTQVPSCMHLVVDLEELDLSFNSMQHVSASLGSLDQLRVLNLGSNRLKSLPDELGKLSNLMQLWISSNNLTTLPSTFSNLRKLVDLNAACASTCVWCLCVCDSRDMQLTGSVMTGQQRRRESCSDIPILLSSTYTTI